MPDAIRLRFQCLIVSGLALWILGCGAGPQAEFKFSEATEGLIPTARKVVEDTLKQEFGTPNALVPRERYPIDYGGVKGTVSSVTSNTTLTAKVGGDAAKVHQGASIVWLTGALAKEKSVVQAVASFNRDSGQLVLSGSSASPAVGDRFSVGFGDDLRFGKQVYMKNCMHCHGVAGDGAGPTGQFLNPRPRDYRNGVFKFTSTKSGEKPTRDDLDRIVKYGIPGTYMPSFLLLGDRETKSVVEYVRWLSIRGEFEKRLVSELSSDYSIALIKDSTERANGAYAEKMKAAAKIEAEAEKKEYLESVEIPPTQAKAIENATAEFAKYFKEDFSDTIDDNSDYLASAWTRAEETESLVAPKVSRVEDTPESRERGRLLYMSDKTKCYTCHGMTGRGDGAATEDFWPKPGTKDKYSEPGLHDEWGQILKPRNLLSGQYRGGRRPIDLFRRMYAGIKGTPMPAFGKSGLQDPEIWDVVNYVMSLPYSTKHPHPASATAEQVKEKSAH